MDIGKSQIEYCLEALKEKKVYALINANNKASKSVIKKSNMKYQKTIQKNQKFLEKFIFLK